MHRLMYAALFSGLSAALVLGAPQQGADQRPTISVETNLVMLPVTVVDRRGEFVAGLTADQFTVYDNGQPQPIQFFTSEEMTATVGIVVDCSTSMRARRDDVTAAATAFAESAHPLDEMFSVNFNEAVWPGLPPGVIFAANVDQLHRALARAPANGMTALFDAVDRALDHLQFGTRDRKALILVSDGGDNASTQTLPAVVERARRSNAVIYSVTIVDPDSRDARPDVLKKLARETGGDVFAPRRAADVVKAFTRIGQEIRTGYMLGFSPPTVANGGFRTIRVVADSGDGRPLIVRTRAGYYAGRNAGSIE
jgi:Ca-activated chloride channel homolog